MPRCLRIPVAPCLLPKSQRRLPLAMPIVVGAVGASVVASPGRYLVFLALYDLLFAVVCWASFEYVVAE